MNQKIISFFLAFIVTIIAILESNPPTNDHVVMLEISNNDWSEHNFSEDIWCESVCVVYYDGTVTFEEHYHQTKVLNQTQLKLSKQEVYQLYNMLKGEFKLYDFDMNSRSAGIGWNFILYNENNKIEHEYLGYIYDYDIMNDIVALVDSRYQNFN